MLIMKNYDITEAKAEEVKARLDGTNAKPKQTD